MEPQNQQHVLSVSQLTTQIKETLEGTFPQVWVSGEMSDISRPQSGHIYFALKDGAAQIRGVMWRGAAQRVRFRVEDGLEVICGGNLDVYPPRGSYQLVVRQIEPIGVGALQLALKQLQQKLAAEGLFDGGRKRTLPPFPRRIAVVTSPTGAAIRDFLEVQRRRWRGVEVLVVSARVQGDGAAEEIVAGIQRANQLQPLPDVLVVGRGGGSLEDLWCFNEENVVRAVFASEIPVVSAVGHEIDVTLTDLVADVRALTPSEAAELVVPSEDEIATKLGNLRQRLTASLRARAAQARAELDALSQRRVLRTPLDHVHELARRVDDLELRARRAVQRQQTTARDRLAAMAGRLDALSPLSVLARGYSLTERLDDGQLVLRAEELKPGDQITTRFTKGEAVSRVEKIESTTKGEAKAKTSRPE